jgi:hypothetical protein
MPKEKLEQTFHVSRKQLDYLERMVAAHSLPDVSKAVRILVAHAMSRPEEEEAIFETVRCASPDVCESGQAAARDENADGA